MNDLKGELASLKIERKRGGASPWRWPLLLFIPVVLVLGVLYGLKARQAMAAPQVETVTPTVSRTETPSAGSPVLTASGYIVARRKAVVSAKIQGRLSELRVEEGSVVKAGQLIARLESVDYEASVARARAAVLRAEADLAENARQARLAERMAKEQVLSADQAEAAVSRVRLAEAGLAQAKADLAFADAQLQNTAIRAPFAGVVVKKMAEVGESVAPIPPGVNLSTSSGAVVALADLETLEVEADVAEANVAKIGNGQPAEVTVEAIPERRYKAVLRQVIPTADRTKATVQVKVTILDKDKDMKPEMSAKVTFLEPEKEKTPTGVPVAVVSVPKSAVVTREGRSVVFLLQEGKAMQKVVVLGTERQGQVVVRNGLSGGERVIDRPAEGIKDGATVRTKQEDR